MKVRLSTFAILQRCNTLVPWLLMAAILSGVIRFFHARGLSWFEAGILLIGGGAIGIGYMAWAMMNDWHGLIRTPRRPWSIVLQGSDILVRTHLLETIIPLDRVVRAEIVVDGSWEQIRGVEDSCLVLRLTDAPQLSIPASTLGFQDVLAGLRGILRINFTELNVD